MVAVATAAMALVGMLIARYLVLPLRAAPALNTLLITLMAGTVLREGVRLFYPQGANPKPFPALLPKSAIDLGGFNLRLDNVLMLAVGALAIVGLQFLLNRTKLGLAIRAVAQDEETARTMGIDFTAIVLITFAIGSALAAFAGVINGLYYNEINFGMGLYLGVDRLFRRHHRRAGQHLWRDPRRFPVCRIADRRRGAAAGGERLQGRIRLRRRHRHHGLAPDRTDPGKDQRAGVSQWRRRSLTRRPVARSRRACVRDRLSARASRRGAANAHHRAACRRQSPSLPAPAWFGLLERVSRSFADHENAFGGCAVLAALAVAAVFHEQPLRAAADRHGAALQRRDARIEHAVRLCRRRQFCRRVVFRHRRLHLRRPQRAGQHSAPRRDRHRRPLGGAGRIASAAAGPAHARPLRRGGDDRLCAPLQDVPRGQRRARRPAGHAGQAA